MDVGEVNDMGRAPNKGMGYIADRNMNMSKSPGVATPGLKYRCAKLKSLCVAFSAHIIRFRYLLAMLLAKEKFKI